MGVLTPLIVVVFLNASAHVVRTWCLSVVVSVPSFNSALSAILVVRLSLLSGSSSLPLDSLLRVREWGFVLV